MNLVEILSALLVPLIAVVTVCIAYQQMKVNSDRLRLELYDRRYHIYDIAIRFVSQIAVGNKEIEIQDVTQFRITTDQGKFIFEEEIQTHMDEIFSKALNLRAVRKNLQGVEQKLQFSQNKELQVKRDFYLEQEITLLDWFDKQSKLLTERFRKYLRFKDLD